MGTAARTVLSVGLFLCAVGILITIIPPAQTQGVIEGPPGEGGGFIINCGFYPGGGGENCSFVHLFELARKVLNLLIWLATTGVALAIVYYGARMAMNVFLYHGDAQRAQNEAKEGLKWALFGLVIVLGAWLFVKFIFDLFGYRFGDPFDFRSEDIVETLPPVPPPPPPSPPGGPPDPAPPGTPGGGCSGCVTLSPDIPCKGRSRNACNVSSSLAGKLENLNNLSDDPPWRVTEAWPPSRTHASSCHSDGTCVDVNFINRNNDATTENIRAFIDAARRSGLDAVYETSDSSVYNELREAGIPRGCRKGSPGVCLLRPDQIFRPSFFRV